MKQTFLLALIALSGFAQAQQGDLIDKIAGVVGNKTILFSDIEGQSLQQAAGETVTDDIRCDVIEQLLFQKLLVNQAEIDSVEILESDIQAAIASRLDYFMSMLGSEEAFTEYYGKSIAEWKEEFHDPIEDQLIADKMQRELMGQVNVTPAEVSELFNSIDSDSLPLIGEQVHYSQIMIKPEISDQDQENARAKLDSIRLICKNGLGSTTMLIQASKWSEDPGSSSNGGCYPIQQRGSFVPEYESAVFATDEGDFSPVFETVYGFHFVYVKKKVGNMYESCHILISPKVDIEDLERAKTDLDDISEKIEIGDLTFPQAVSKYSTDESTKNQEGRVINLASGGTGHEISQLQDPKLFLALNSLEQGKLSTPVELTQADGTMAWAILRLDKRVPAHTANLKDDYLIFKTQAESVKRNDDLDKWVTKKLESTYIRIDAEYQGCDYAFKWTEAGQTRTTDK